MNATYRKYNSADATGCCCVSDVPMKSPELVLLLPRLVLVLPRLEATQCVPHSERHSDQGSGERNES